jgi:hypothetical protein
MNTEFVSIDEQALEGVSGGLLDLLNHALNGNDIDILSGFCINIELGDVLSNLLNIGNTQW